MEHQDWKPVVLVKEQRKPQTQRAPGSKDRDILLSDNPEPPKTVGLDTGKKIQQARCAKKLTQSQLAKSLNLPESTIKSFENGTAKLDKVLLRRITTFLGL